MHLIGLDIGTTSCKAVLFDENGLLIQKASREYTVDFPHPDWAEQDIEAVWALVQESLREVIARSGIKRIAALSISAHGEAVTPVDQDGRALRPTILGMDTRTGEQNRWLVDHLGAEYLFETTGCRCIRSTLCPSVMDQAVRARSVETRLLFFVGGGFPNPEDDR